MKWWKIALLSALVGSIGTPATALDFECSEFRPLLGDRDLERPDPPPCVSSFGSFADSYAFDSCRSDVEAYRATTEKYLRCLDSEGKEAINDFNEAVRAFNQRASY